MLTAEQRTARRSMIGSSDAAAVPLPPHATNDRVTFEVWRFRNGYWLKWNTRADEAEAKQLADHYRALGDRAAVIVIDSRATVLLDTARD